MVKLDFKGLYDVGVRKRLNFDRLAAFSKLHLLVSRVKINLYTLSLTVFNSEPRTGLDVEQASKAILAIDVHGLNT